jgi:predicted permease
MQGVLLLLPDFGLILLGWVLYRLLDVGDPFWSGLEKLVYFVLLAAKLLAASSFGLRGVYFDTAVLFGALPTATSAYILAVRMGGDGPGVAWLISANTLAAMLTLPVWLSIAARF